MKKINEWTCWEMYPCLLLSRDQGNIWSFECNPASYFWDNIELLLQYTYQEAGKQLGNFFQWGPQGPSL